MCRFWHANFHFHGQDTSRKNYLLDKSLPFFAKKNLLNHATHSIAFVLCANVQSFVYLRIIEAFDNIVALVRMPQYGIYLSYKNWVV